MKLKMSVKLISILMLSLMVLLIPLSGCTPKSSTTTTTTTTQATAELQIGSLVTLSGPMSGSFARMNDGENAAADWINNNGGITIGNTKYTIKIVSVDDAGTPDGAIAGTNKLVYDDNIKFMAIGPMTELSIPSGQITDKEKVLRIKMGYLTLPGELSDYTFASHSEVPFLSLFLQKFLATYPNVKKIALVSPSDQAGLYLRDLDKAAAQKAGLSVVAEESFDPSTSDFYPLCTKLLASNPDAISISVGIAPWFGGILKQVRELGFTGPVLSPTNSGDITLVNNIAGASATDYYGLDFDVTSTSMPAMISTIGGIIKSKYNVDLTVDHLYGFEAIWDITQAITNAKSIDPTVVKNVLQQTTSIDTPFGKGSVGGKQTYGLNNVIVRPEPICRIMNGKITTGDWLSPTLP